MAYTRSYCQSLVSNWSREAKNIKKYIQKNFEEMDFENAKQREELEELIQACGKELDRIAENAKSYTFE